MRRRLICLPFVVTLLAGGPAGAQVGDSTQPGQSTSAQASTKSSTTEPAAFPIGGAQPASVASEDEVVVNGTKTPLPKLPPDELSSCMKLSGNSGISGSFDPIQSAMCQAQFEHEKRIVVESCVNNKRDTALPRVIQACTELIDRKIFEGRDRFPLFANRARAYLAQGDKAQALDDYNQAVNLAPHDADVYYARGLLFLAQANDDAALQDFDTAITTKPKLVPALRQRALIYQHRDNFGGALADYAEAIRLDPKNAMLWSERGYVSLRQRDYHSALKDEAQAIILDPKLAWAYFLRGTASGNLGDSNNASSDIKTAVGLEPSLAKYVVIKDKTASLLLPPPPG